MGRSYPAQLTSEHWTFQHEKSSGKKAYNDVLSFFEHARKTQWRNYANKGRVDECVRKRKGSIRCTTMPRKNSRKMWTGEKKVPDYASHKRITHSRGRTLGITTYAREAIRGSREESFSRPVLGSIGTESSTRKNNTRRKNTLRIHETHGNERQHSHRHH